MGAPAGVGGLGRGIWWLAVVAAVPGAFAAAHTLTGAGAEAACDAAYVPPPGPLRVRVFLGSMALAARFDPATFEAYLGDRAGRGVQVSGLAVAGTAGFEAHAGQRGVWDEVLAHFLDAPTVEGIAAADGTVGGLGYAREHGACVRVAFGSRPAVPWTDAAGRDREVPPAFAYFAHELGHVFGLGHTAAGLMGHGAYTPGQGDTFDPAQRAALARVGPR